MAIITFWSNGREQVGKTLSTVAIATNVAIEHNKKSIVISTSYKDKTLLNCYYNGDQENIQKNIFKSTKKSVELGSGIQGLFTIYKSGKISPDVVTDYTKIVFKERLELLVNTEVKEELNEDDKEIIRNYHEIIKIANQYYDYVFVDLDNKIGHEQVQKILKMSDIIVETFSQRITKIKELLEEREKNPILTGKNTILLLAKYNKKSKYKLKNLNRILNEKKEIYVIPYNILFFEAAEEGTVPDLFLRLRKMIDKTDEHAVFISEVKKVSEKILDTNHELQLRIR